MLRAYHQINPGRLLIISYLSVILVGSLLLMLPISSKNISPIDALYTATSAVCVTGLIVKNTAFDFTLFGKLVILLLIQIGGIGYMTLSTAIFFFIGKKPNLQERLTIKESFCVLNYSNLTKFALDVIKVTLIVEGIGMVLLFIYFRLSHMQFSEALFHALFHAVSAFCNAGFSSFPENLARFSHVPYVQLVISALIISGGIGFVVISDLYNRYIKRISKHLSLHSKTVLSTTLILILSGTVVISLLEWGNALKIFPWPLKILNAYFTAVTPRTAGFNTIDFSSLSYPTCLIIIFLMFIGASPGGTGGGIKTTTLSVIIAQFNALLSGRSDVFLFRRRVPQDQIFKAFLIVGFALSWLLTGLVFLYILNKSKLDMLTAVFELFSAFGTVGLSLGSKLAANLSASYDFSSLGKVIIVITMFLGRVGILTVITSLIKKRYVNYTHPEGVILVG
ncbi:MAG: TrkH family potassium uptake protein [candidate division WOR-3 bacterium]|nr:TrkH family potassium uptake protein [candidate division WOR-3 bacterium]